MRLPENKASKEGGLLSGTTQRALSAKYCMVLSQPLSYLANRVRLLSETYNTYLYRKKAKAGSSYLKNAVEVRCGGTCPSHQ